jgi:hypothetical protein
MGDTDPILVYEGFSVHNNGKSDLGAALLSVDDEDDLYFVLQTDSDRLYDVYLIPRENMPKGFENKLTRIDKHSASLLSDIILGLYEHYFLLKVDDGDLLSEFEVIARSISQNTVEFYVRPTYNSA